MKNFITAFFSLLFLAALTAAAASIWAYYELSRPGPLAQDALVHIAPGSSVAAIGRHLQKENIIRYDWLFIAGARIKSADKSLRAGEYDIPAQASVFSVIDTLVSGKMHQYTLTIPEGLNSYQIVALLNAHDALTGDIAEIPADGTLFPETYAFTRGTTRAALLARMRGKMDRVLQNAWDSRAEDLPFTTMEEALILASIIEKETGIGAEREKVAGVFVNRLRRGMKLQTDPTVIYALTDGGKNPMTRQLLRRDWELEHPYNTYYIEGLPPGPICHPGRASIEAAVNPARHDYLYFVADGTGGHAFARTLAEHNRNVAAWQRLRREQ
ncbi:MAG: endolytic transglycosylase MltG [Micavibrio sp.]|nr:MAG: endolytic transglycosylase MltG [Micavibrio sp.]